MNRQRENSQHRHTVLEKYRHHSWVQAQEMRLMAERAQMTGVQKSMFGVKEEYDQTKRTMKMKKERKMKKRNEERERACSAGVFRRVQGRIHQGPCEE